MSKAYIIGHVTVRDAEAYKEYIRRDTPVIEGFGGRFVIRGGKSEVMEGEFLERHVVIEFPDYATALACYHSDAYQECARIRQGAAEGQIVIVEGV